MEVVSTEKRLATRRALMEAATDLVFERGHEKISIQDITTRAKVSTGTFYNYFDTKTEIFGTVAEEMRQEIAATLEETRRKINDPAMLVAVTLKYYFTQSLDNTDWNEYTRCAGLGQMLLQQDPEELKADLERGVKGGRFRLDDLHFSQHLISGMITHVNQAIARGHVSRHSIDQAIRSILQMLGLPEMVSRAIIQTALPPIMAPKRGAGGAKIVTSMSEYTRGKQQA